MDRAKGSLSSSTQIFMEGFLIKRGHVRHNWKTRWFKLSDTSLRYYKNKKHTVPQGRIPLMKATLEKVNVFGGEESNDRDREHVFKVTTESGSDYPIQASTKSEFEIWTETIQSVIDRMDPEKAAHVKEVKRQVEPEPENSGESIDMRQHAEMFVKMGNSQEGIKLEARTIDGVRYTQGFSGTELQRWVWKNMGLIGTNAEVTVSGLIRVGLIHCLTADVKCPVFADTHYYRLEASAILTNTVTTMQLQLTDETSLKSMSTTYVNNINSNSPPPSQPASSHAGKVKATKSSRPKDASGLPSDLPPGDILKRGILFKRGHVVPSWKARCFVLQEFPATLSYFDPAKKNPKIINSLSLYGATVFSVGKIAAEVALSMQNPPEHLFCVKTSSGTLYLIIAASDSERDDWIKAIKPMCRRKTGTSISL